uniref:Uncharacterized protein n=1 Tax=Arundo donax TaxID=35708 RepID=A0A0A9D5R1_ARUDO
MIPSLIFPFHYSHKMINSSSRQHHPISGMIYLMIYVAHLTRLWHANAMLHSLFKTN